jgi:predicted pyridoxine 5'-phosphate oxidase superfamily flavin-nucleotide-binding protein
MTLLSAPFHADERAAQQLSGYGFSAGAIRDQMPEQHRSFFEGLSYVLVGVLDEQGWPIATLLTGAPGFIRSPDPATLAVRALTPSTQQCRASRCRTTSHCWASISPCADAIAPTARL